MKWEYLQLDIDDGSKPINWESLGNQGWELVQIYRATAYFKRKATKMEQQFVKFIIPDKQVYDD